MSRRIWLSLLLALPLAALAAGCLGSVLGAVASTDRKAGHAVRLLGRTVDAFREISFTEEREVGLSIGAQIMKTYGILKCPEVDRYLNLVVSTVGAYSDRAGIKYYAAVMPTSQINAVSCPGGYIFVSYGLLLALKDESELAGVFGHEIAHICEKHVLRTIQNIKRREMVAEAVAWDNQDSFNSLVDDLSRTITGAPTSRRYEVNCDRLGTVYVAAAGYRPGGLVHALEKMKTLGMDTRTGHYGKLDDRIAEAVKYGRERGVTETGATLSERYQARCIQPLKAALAAAGLPAAIGARR